MMGQAPTRAEIDERVNRGATCLDQHDPNWALRLRVENVIMDPETRALDFDDATITENTRVGYPVTFIPNCVEEGVGGHVALRSNRCFNT